MEWELKEYQTVFSRLLACTFICSVIVVKGEAPGSRSLIAAATEEPSEMAGLSHSLVPVSFPDLKGLEEPVQRQIRAAQAELAVARKPGTSESDLAQAYGRLGELYHTYRLYDAAAACYLNAQILAPAKFKWPYYLGYLFQTQGDVEKAAVYFSAAVKIRPDDEVALLRLADTNLQLNHLEQAKLLYERVRALDKSSFPACYGQGKVALAERSFPKAIEYFNQALVIDPDANYVHYPLAMAYRGLGDSQEAQAHLLKQGPGAPHIRDPLVEELERLQAGRADTLLQAYQAIIDGRVAEGIELFRKSVVMAPDDPVARTYLAIALARAGDSRGAIRQFSEALRIAPQHAEAHYGLGVVLMDLGEDGKATEHLEAAIESDPLYTEAHFQLANLLMRRGNYDKASGEYAKVLDRDPANASAGLMHAMALVRVNDYSGARTRLEGLHAELPQNADIAGALARLLAASPDKTARDGPRALDLIERVVKSQGSLGDVEQGQTLAMAFATVGQFEKAVAVQRWIIATLEGQGTLNLIPFLRENLALYERGEPCRLPWRSDDPIFSPVPKKSELPPERPPMAKQR